MVFNISFTKIGKLKIETSKLKRIKYFLENFKFKDINFYENNELFNTRIIDLIRILKELESVDWNLFSENNLRSLNKKIIFREFNDSLRFSDLSNFSQKILELKSLLEEIYESIINSDTDRIIRDGVNSEFLNIKILKIAEDLKAAFGEISPRNYLLGGFLGYLSEKPSFLKRFFFGTALAGVFLGIPGVSEANQIPNAAITTTSGSIRGKFERTFRWNKQIAAAERKYKIEEGILGGLIMRESEGDPLKLNSRDDGGAGLMMFQPGTARLMGLKVYGNSKATGVDRRHGRALRSLVIKHNGNLKILANLDQRFDIEKSIDTGARYLRRLYDKYSTWNASRHGC